MRASAGLAVVFAFATATSPLPARGAEVMLVHLPSAPMENSARVASAVTSLAAYLNAEVSALELEVKIFRRWQDADAFFVENRSNVLAVLGDASFFLDHPLDEGLIPSWRFVRSGSETYQRLVVVRTESEEIQGLAGLRGRSLQIVKTTGEQTEAYLARSVFGGEVAPQTWFGSIDVVADDFTAVASVLHGKADAALVAEHNPLLLSELGAKLRAVYRSPSLSLPVLALRADALSAEQQSAFYDALARIGENNDGPHLLEDLGVDGLRPIASGDREVLLRLPTSERKVMEIALPASSDVPLAPFPPPSPEDVTFGLTLELPEFPSAQARIRGKKTP